MKILTVKWNVRARDGNACYRPSSDASRLQEIIEESLSNLDSEVELRLEENLLTSVDETSVNHLVIEDRNLSTWLDDMDEKHREWFQSAVKSSLESGEFEGLTRKDFLEEVLQHVINSEVD